jgi:hypothetical protein
LSSAISQRHRRTYFNKPLVEESLRYLPAAINHPTSVQFRAYLAENLHHSSRQTRERFAAYIAQRFSQDGKMNLALARALAKFSDSRTGREILYFELLRSAPVLHDIASLWLAEQPDTGAPRSSLLAFLEKRLGGKSADLVAGAAVEAFRRCRKLSSPKPAIYIPVWSEPSLEAFLYVLARLYPDRTMVRFDLFASQPVIRALLWPRPCLAPLLEKARLAGHISRISELDQYHQFTLVDAGDARMRRLVGDPSASTLTARESTATYGSSPATPPPDRRPPTPRARRKKPPTKPRAGRAAPSSSRSKKPTSKAKGGRKTPPRQLSFLPKEE